MIIGKDAYNIMMSQSTSSQEAGQRIQLFIPLYYIEKNDALKNKISGSRELYFLKGWAIAEASSSNFSLVFTGNPCDRVYGFMLEENLFTQASSDSIGDGIPVVAENAVKLEKEPAVLPLSIKADGNEVKICGYNDEILELMKTDAKGKRIENAYSSIQHLIKDWNKLTFLEEARLIPSQESRSQASQSGGRQ